MSTKLAFLVESGAVNAGAAVSFNSKRCFIRRRADAVGIVGGEGKQTLSRPNFGDVKLCHVANLSCW